MKPDWSDAPEWAQWLVMNRDGSWCWHESEPQTASQSAFFFSFGRVAKADHICFLNWRESKQPRQEPIREAT